MKDESTRSSRERDVFADDIESRIRLMRSCVYLAPPVAPAMIEQRLCGTVADS